MLLNQIFPHRICINLERRADRWQRMQAEFARHGIEGVQRFPAVDGGKVVLPASWRHSAGAYGCLLSHVAVVQEALAAGSESVLIFEDDAVFDSEFDTKFASFMKEVPADWDLLYFGALHKDEPVKVTEHVYRITKANSTYAYALKRTVFEDFIELNRRADRTPSAVAHPRQCSSRRSSRRNFGANREVMPTTASVMQPPKITDGTRPSSFAATPDSNAPTRPALVA